MNSEQKVAIVTGASQGIGAGLVDGFRQLGYAIIASSRSIQSFHTSSDPSVLAIEGDIADPQTAIRIVDAATQRFGRIDTLVNNAGIFVSKPFVDYTDADFSSILAVNVTGFFHVTRAALPQMLKNASGHIVNITSALAEQPMASVPAALAALTKGGLNAATRSLAIEYADRGIRVNAVSPGAIKTPIHAPEAHGFLAGLQPIGRMGEIREIVEAVLYLETASFVTGEILHVDGGANAGRW